MGYSFVLQDDDEKTLILPSDEEVSCWIILFFLQVEYTTD